MAARERPQRARFFASGEAFRAWLEAHHRRPEGLLVGLYRKQSGKGGLTYPQALDAALCFGWIDGPRKGLDERAYTIHFSPRREGSVWSRVNLRHVERLRSAGLMRPAGEAALARRDPERTGVYAFERPPAELGPGELAMLRAAPAAHRFFEAQPPGWRRTVLFWVCSAKRPETRAFRLRALLEHSARGERVSLLKPPAMGR